MACFFWHTDKFITFFYYVLITSGACEMEPFVPTPTQMSFVCSLQSVFPSNVITVIYFCRFSLVLCMLRLAFRSLSIFTYTRICDVIKEDESHTCADIDFETHPHKITMPFIFYYFKNLPSAHILAIILLTVSHRHGFGNVQYHETKRTTSNGLSTTSDSSLIALYM